ncbi:scavenger receptor class B member 1-like [Vespa velutina]|uniref:scavenger receptor class B member 1-like n=1 Tax=Vespa velutina TaxID=202808 RepID=UPI001FB1D9CD|nr:scavenger receptor class B member 1-like [Vespa velutina]
MKSVEKNVTVQKDQTNFLKNWYVWIITIVGLSSFFLIVIFWCTNIFKNTILSNLIIEKGTTNFDFWERPPVNLIYKFYIFNYTNIEDFERGKANKLRVQQLGPYIYRETKERVNIQIHENGTISYQEEKSYQWESGNPENEMIIVPNILLLATISHFRNLPITAKFLLNIGMSTLNLKPFLNLTVRDFLWGYDDNLYNILKTFNLLNHLYFEKFGILVGYNGTSKDRITINTGSNDIDYLGIIENINGINIQNIWGDNRCDRIYGTDGSIFPPKWIDNYSTPLYIYVKELCKPLSFHFREYGKVQGVPSLRYKMSMDSLMESSTDSCFCPKIIKKNNEWKRKCPPNGFLNISACNFDVPILISFPNFYGADQSSIESIDGLKPDETLHESFLDLHQFLAVPMNGSLKIQMNIEVQKVSGMPYTGELKDGTILPIIWYENTLDVLPQKFINIFFGGHFVIMIIELAFRWGSILIFLSSICHALFIILRKYSINRLCVIM